MSLDLTITISSRLGKYIYMTHINFIVDCSGSMAAPVSRNERKFGKYIESVTRSEAMRYTVQQFLKFLNADNSTDTFSIIEFSDTAYPLVANMRADSTNYSGRKDIMTVIEDLDNMYVKPISGPYGRNEPIFHPRGGTNIPEALKVTLRQTPRNTPTINLLFTDMYDLNGDYIFNALMSKNMLDALMANGPLIVTIIAGPHDRINADRSARALQTKVNQYELSKLSYKELQARCKKAGMPAVGKKEQLIDRLLFDRGGISVLRDGNIRFSCVVETFENEVDFYSPLKAAGLA